MAQRKAFSEFEESCIKPRFQASLREAEALFQQEKDIFKAQFLNNMDKICSQHSDIGSDRRFAYMTWELLRTRMRVNQDEYRIMLYGKDWYLEPGIEAGTMDASLILQVYYQLEYQLKEDAKRYVGKITPIDVEYHVSYLLPPFHEYIKELILYAIADATELEAFKGLRKEAEFQIRVGECLEPGYLVYMEKQKKCQEEILEWLKSNRQENFCFQDFQGLNFSGEDLSRYDLRNTDFRDAMLEGTKLCLSLLIGARFQRSSLREAKLCGSMLHGADFSGADLQKAHMEGTLMYDGKDSLNSWHLAGYPEGRFTGANLQEAVFRECIYCGADFREADLRGADFAGADLWRCRFTKEQLTQTGFTEEQKRQICLIG